MARPKIHMELWHFAGVLLAAATHGVQASVGGHIVLPSTVTAGATATATVAASFIDSDIHLDTSYIQIYLASGTTEEGFLGPDFFPSQCTLIQSLNPCNTTNLYFQTGNVTFINTTVPFTIPIDVGPSGQYYALRLEVLPGDLSRLQLFAPSLTSDAFFLSNATGVFSVLQRAGADLPDASWYPCSSFACVTNCVDSVFSINDGGPKGGANGTGPSWPCVENCPGVSSNTTIKGPGTTCGAAAGTTATTTTTASSSLSSAQPVTVTDGSQPSSTASGTGSAAAPSSTGSAAQLARTSWGVYAGMCALIAAAL